MAPLHQKEGLPACNHQHGNRPTKNLDRVAREQETLHTSLTCTVLNKKAGLHSELMRSGAMLSVYLRMVAR